MSDSHGALLVVGSGPGIGVNVAMVFAEQGFNKIVLMSRNSERLENEVTEVKNAAPNVEVVASTIDLASKKSVTQGLEQAEKHLQSVKLECVLFNAARIGPSSLMDFTPEEVENDMHISVISLHMLAQWAIPQLVETAKDASAKPCFLVTSGGLAKNPRQTHFSLAMAKAAQYNYVWSLHKEYTPQGVHCALIVVQGLVKDTAEVTTPRHIAEVTWDLAQQDKATGWDLDVDIIDPQYPGRR